MTAITSNEYAVTTPNQLASDFKVEKSFKAGDTFPVSFQASGDVFQLEPSTSGVVKITHDFFVQATENDLLFSLDGNQWSEFTELFTGNFGFSFDPMEPNPTLQGVFVANLRNPS